VAIVAVPVDMRKFLIDSMHKCAEGVRRIVGREVQVDRGKVQILTVAVHTLPERIVEATDKTSTSGIDVTLLD